MGRKIKVLVDAHVFDGMYQGTRTYIRGLYRALASSDRIEIFLAAQNIKELAKEFEGVGNVNFLKLNSASALKRLLIEIPELVNSHGFDYIHFQYMDSPIKCCKTIVTIHDVLFLDFPNDFSWLYRQKKHLFKIAASRADILSTVSFYSQQRISHHFNIPQEQIHVVKEGIDESYFFSGDPEFSREYIQGKFSVTRVILFVSRVEPRKNHILLLQAFLELRLWEKGFHLVFIGNTSIRSAELDLMISAMPESAIEYFHHFERVSQEDLIHFFQASHIFVYPTRAEGFGFPPLEAAAMKVQTLLSNATSLAEFKFFGDRFFDPDHVEELKIKILRLIENPGSFANMDTISALVQNEYNWDRCAERMESLIVSDFTR